MDRVLTYVSQPATAWTAWVKRVRKVSVWMDVWTERRHLERLDQRMLADIGLTDVQARTEAERPIWDLPQNRFL